MVKQKHQGRQAQIAKTAREVARSVARRNAKEKTASQGGRLTPAEILKQAMERR